MIEEVKELLKKNKNPCVITDFDYTLTDYSSYSSIGVFSNYLEEEYCKKKEIIDKQIKNLKQDEEDHFYELWKRKIELLQKYANPEIIDQITNDNNFILRDEGIDLLEYCRDNKIDVYILSSGCKEVIEQVLIKNKINFSNITLIANSYTKPITKVITPRNKKEFFQKDYSLYIQMGDEKEDFFIKNNCHYVEYFKDYAFRILSKHKNKKCQYGLCLYKDKKAFYKTVFTNIENEIKGYELVSKYFQVPKLICYNENMILYEYIEDFLDKSLYDYLYINPKLHIDYPLILNQYKESLKHIKQVEEQELKNDLFYQQRVSILEKYSKNPEYQDYQDLFLTIKDKISKKKKLHAFVSQGDPTDTNITTTGIFCDFENGGYNSIVGELAIFIISILSHGAWIYPKYNSKVYCIKKSKQKNLNITDKNIELILNYLEFFKTNLNDQVIKELNEYLKYYICFRILTPIDIDSMDKKDKMLILKELSLFYQTKNLEEIIQMIRGWKYEIS